MFLTIYMTAESEKLEPFDEFCKLAYEDKKIGPVAAYDLLAEAKMKQEYWQAHRIALAVISHNGNHLLEEVYKSDPGFWEDSESAALQLSVRHFNPNGRSGHR